MEKAARRAREHPAVLLAAGAMALSGALLLHWFSRITFWRDEWVFLLHRRSWSVGTFLDPAGEHLLRGTDPDLQAAPRGHGHELPTPVPGGRRPLLSAQRRAPLRLRAGAGRGMAGACGRAPHPLPRPVVVGPPVPVSDRLLRLDGLRPRGAPLPRSPNPWLGHRGNGAAVRRAAFLRCGHPVRGGRCGRSRAWPRPAPAGLSPEATADSSGDARCSCSRLRSSLSAGTGMADPPTERWGLSPCCSGSGASPV